MGHLDHVWADSPAKLKTSINHIIEWFVSGEKDKQVEKRDLLDMRSWHCLDVWDIASFTQVAVNTPSVHSKHLPCHKFPIKQSQSGLSRFWPHSLLTGCYSPTFHCGKWLLSCRYLANIVAIFLWSAPDRKETEVSLTLGLFIAQELWLIGAGSLAPWGSRALRKMKWEDGADEIYMRTAAHSAAEKEGCFCDCCKGHIPT